MCLCTYAYVYMYVCVYEWHCMYACTIVLCMYANDCIYLCIQCLQRKCLTSCLPTCWHPASLSACLASCMPAFLPVTVCIFLLWMSHPNHRTTPPCTPRRMQLVINNPNNHLTDRYSDYRRNDQIRCFAKWHMRERVGYAMFFCLSVFLYVGLSVCLSFCLSFYLFVCLSFCLSVCLSLCMFVCYESCMHMHMVWNFVNWHSIYLSKILGGQTKILGGGRKVVKSYKCMGVSQLFVGYVLGLPPP